MVVLQLWNRSAGGCNNSNESDLDSKHTNNKAMEQTDPRLRRNSARLAFAHHMDRFVTGQGAPSTPERPEMLRAWAKPFGPLAKAIFHPLSSVLESFARIMQFR
jgi:hypothetical protein